jgi:hypothetical protein
MASVGSLQAANSSRGGTHAHGVDTMPHRVAPTEHLRGLIDELFTADRPPPEILEDVARLGAS